MKLLLLGSVLLLSLSAHSAIKPNFLGGELKTSEGRRMGAVCSGELTPAGCSELSIYFKEKNQDSWRVVGKYYPAEREDMLKQATQSSDAQISVRMLKWYFLPTMAALHACVSKAKPVCPFIGVALVFDLIKLPVVAATHVTLAGHNIVTSVRFLSYLNYMANPKKQGKDRTLTKINFTAMIAGVDDLPF